MLFAKPTVLGVEGEVFILQVLVLSFHFIPAVGSTPEFLSRLIDLARKTVLRFARASSRVGYWASNNPADRALHNSGCMPDIDVRHVHVVGIAVLDVKRERDERNGFCGSG